MDTPGTPRTHTDTMLCRVTVIVLQQAASVDRVTSGRHTQAEAARLFNVIPATVNRPLDTQQPSDAMPLHATCDE